MSFLGLSVVSLYQGDYTTAEEYAKKALQITQDLGDKSRIASVFGFLGSYASHQKDYNKAEDFFKKELKIVKELGNKELIASALEDFSGLAKEQKKYTESKRRYKESLKLFEEIGAKNTIALTQKLLETTEEIKKLHHVLELKRQEQKALYEKKIKNI
ncbi:Tetratricopeptide (TPR) repeat [Methanophagales archaeon]|nr:Tetratricopeptide (TPR) repeat [Methanophagales archaeon]